MNLLQAGFLFGGLAMLLPIIVHWLNRWQVRRVEIGTMRFLNEVIRDGAQSRKIRRWFLLLTRMALIALLALLFARPFIIEPSRRDGDRLRIILIDRSASMSMPGRQGRLVDDAVSEAIKSASELGEDAQIVWAWFDQAVETISESASRISAPKVVAGGTNYQAAIAYARDQVHSKPTSVADVVLITDLQQTGMSDSLLAESDLQFPADVPVRIVDVGRAAASNLSISNLSVPSTRLSEDRRAILTATLFNYGSLPFEDAPIVASATQGKRTVRLKKTVSIDPGQAQEVAFDLDKLSPGLWQCIVTVDVNDDLASDNVRYAALEITQPYEVLVIDRSPESKSTSESQNAFLIAALQQGTKSIEQVANDANTESQSNKVDGTRSESMRRSNGRFSPQLVDLEKKGMPQWPADKVTLAVVANAANLSRADIDHLEGFANNGGRLLVFAGDPIEASAGDWVQQWNDSQIAPGKLGRPQASGVSPFRIANFAAGTTMLEPFDDPQHGDLKRLSFHTILPVQPARNTRVLAWFDEQKPAITQHTIGKGSVAFFLSSSDSSWSSWTMSPLYLPLVQQMSAELLNLNGEGPIRSRTIGEVQLASSGTASRNVTASAGDSPLKLVSMRDSETKDQADNKQVDGKPLNITFDQAGFEQREDALYVVNPLAAESDPTRITPEALSTRYGLSLAEENGTKIQSTVSSTKRIELWPWLAAALVLLLIGEFALANRTAP